MFLQQTAAGRQKIAEAEQEQRTGSGRSGMLASTANNPPVGDRLSKLVQSLLLSAQLSLCVYVACDRVIEDIAGRFIIKWTSKSYHGTCDVTAQYHGHYY